MIGSILLQITTSLQDTVHTVPAPPAVVQSLSFFDLIVKGGIIMIPIGLLSLLMVYLFIERWITIKKASRPSRKVMSNVSNMVILGIQGWFVFSNDNRSHLRCQ